MATSVKALHIGGYGRTAEIDGSYFGGGLRPENLAADHIHRQLLPHQSGKRRVVVAMRKRGVTGMAFTRMSRSARWRVVTGWVASRSSS